MKPALLLLPLFFLLASCASDPFSGVRRGVSPEIINVSSYDPKERQRGGLSYTPDDVSSLRKNGAHGLIARVSKGSAADVKAARFLKAADREGMLVGVYHFVLPGISVTSQADRMLERVRAIGNDMDLKAPGVLLVGDFDSSIPAKDVARFITRVRERTGGVTPLVYLENADRIKKSMRAADPQTRAILRSAPYWMALYGHVDKMDSVFSVRGRDLSPGVMLDIYQVWDDWALWQYGGVWWDRSRGRSVPHYYNRGGFRSGPYFGNMDRPMERNVFNGTVPELRAFWARHSWNWR